MAQSRRVPPGPGGDRRIPAAEVATRAGVRLRKELWAFTDNRISVRFEYECHDHDGQWWRSHGNEHWEFDESGLMRRRDASINDYRIEEHQRRITS